MLEGRKYHPPEPRAPITGCYNAATSFFKYALVQDAAYVTLVRSRRQQLHSRVADTLIEAFPELVKTQLELVAHHLVQAGLAEKAIEYLRKAG